MKRIGDGPTTAKQMNTECNGAAATLIVQAKKGHMSILRQDSGTTRGHMPAFRLRAQMRPSHSTTATRSRQEYYYRHQWWQTQKGYDATRDLPHLMTNEQKVDLHWHRALMRSRAWTDKITTMTIFMNRDHEMVCVCYSPYAKYAE